MLKAFGIPIPREETAFNLTHGSSSWRVFIRGATARSSLKYPSASAASPLTPLLLSSRALIRDGTIFVSLQHPLEDSPIRINSSAAADLTEGSLSVRRAFRIGSKIL